MARHVRKATICAIGALAVAAIPASADLQPRVIGGEVADGADWSAVVALTDDFGQFCGGTLLSPRRVLTAKHCVLGPLDPNLEVIAGRTNLKSSSEGQEISVIRRHRHPRADIAVLKLAEPALPAPFAVATRRQNRATTGHGDEILVAGWGATRPSGGKPSNLLREGKQYGKPGKRCRRTFPFFRNWNMICALGREIEPRQHGSACYGDSGGPLVADTAKGRILVGTVSGGSWRCGAPRQPSFYVRVSAYRDWILKHLP